MNKLWQSLGYVCVLQTHHESNDDDDEGEKRIFAFSDFFTENRRLGFEQDSI